MNTYQYVHKAQLMALSGMGHWHSLKDYEGYQRTGQWDCLDKDECMGLDPAEVEKMDLQSQIDEWTEIQAHLRGENHISDDNGFCYCGWDGNA